MTDVTRRERNPRGQGERLRDELIEHALRLLSGTGNPDDVSIRAVARATGVTPTAVYRHFEDRDDLVEAACQANFVIFREYLADRFADHVDPFARLAAAGHAYLEFAEEDPGRYRVLFSNPHSATHELDAEGDDPSAGSLAFLQLVALVQACIDAGARPPGGTAEYVAYQVWTWMHGIADLRITHPRFPWPPAGQMVDDLAVALGLAGPAAR